MYAINLLNFFLLFNGLRKIKIRLDALQRNRNYLHVLHCAKIKRRTNDRMWAITADAVPRRWEYLRVLLVLKNRDRYFAGFRVGGIINILPDGDTIADGCFVQTRRRGGDQNNNNFLAHPLLSRGPRKIEITVAADSHAYTVGTHHDGVVVLAGVSDADKP